jgi:hypothetical protein
MTAKTFVLSFIYVLFISGVLLIISHLVVSIRLGIFTKFRRPQNLSNEDLLTYQQKIQTIRKYVRLGGILAIAGRLGFIMLSALSA